MARKTWSAEAVLARIARRTDGLLWSLMETLPLTPVMRL